MTPAKTVLLRQVAVHSKMLRLPIATRSIHCGAISSPRAFTIATRRPLSSTITSTPSRRWDSSTAAAAAPGLETPDYLSEGELKIFNILKSELQPSKLEVQDISGGCGSMYGLDIVSERFRGLTVIKQHRLVNAVLKDEIKKWHGVQLKTKAP